MSQLSKSALCYRRLRLRLRRRIKVVGPVELDDRARERVGTQLLDQLRNWHQLERRMNVRMNASKGGKKVEQCG